MGTFFCRVHPGGAYVSAFIDIDVPMRVRLCFCIVWAFVGRFTAEIEQYSCRYINIWASRLLQTLAVV